MAFLSVTPLSCFAKQVLLILSLIIVGFGQPLWGPFFSFLASVFGYALFWIVLINIPSWTHRFWAGTCWYWVIGIVQYVWSLSHPYVYIYPTLLLATLFLALPWGLLSIFITKRNASHAFFPLWVAAYWSLVELGRFFIVTGFGFNPAGLALSYSEWSVQGASLLGITGLSFWVLCTNGVFFRLCLSKERKAFWVTWLIIFVVAPIGYGFVKIRQHRPFLEHSKGLSILAVQPAFLLETDKVIYSAEDRIEALLGKWERLFALVAPYIGKQIDLVVFPEYVLPYGTIYPVLERKRVFEIWKKQFPNAELPAFSEWVSNGEIAQSLTALLQAPLIMGLEDQGYSGAILFDPTQPIPLRYAKRLLLPFGEYIPWEWCRRLANRYGVVASLIPGQEAACFDKPVCCAPSICCEEMYGNLIREGRVLGAELLVNLTNDGWYPDSFLPQQHFDHARIRTVENGVPLVRACNTGITAAIDSLGGLSGKIEGDWIVIQSQQGALLVNLPTYHYCTLYSLYGDQPLMLLCIGILLLGAAFGFLHKLS